MSHNFDGPSKKEFTLMPISPFPFSFLLIPFEVKHVSFEGGAVAVT